MTTLQEPPVEPNQELKAPEPETPEPENARELDDEAGPAFAQSSTARALRSAGISLLMLGALVISFVFYLVLISSAQHDRDQVTMYADFRYALAQGTAPVGPTTSGRPVAIIEIPRIKLREVVVEGTTASDLAHGPGHRRDTPLPGQVGVSVVYGRAETFGGPFGGLKRLRPGDGITVTTGQGVSKYTVTHLDGTVLAPAASGGGLVLVTADSRLAQRQDLIVSAQLNGQAWPGNPKLPVITKAEVGLQGEPAAVIALVLWSQALLLGAVATTWAYIRWARWPTYIISTPILIAILWNVYENIARLLPNTF